LESVFPIAKVESTPLRQLLEPSLLISYLISRFLVIQRFAARCVFGFEVGGGLVFRCDQACCRSSVGKDVNEMRSSLLLPESLVPVEIFPCYLGGPNLNGLINRV
jgi:hypothetical protein